MVALFVQITAIYEANIYFDRFKRFSAHISVVNLPLMKNKSEVIEGSALMNITDVYFFY
jgi:hypothetical protein